MKEKNRNLIQFVSAVLTNGNLKGFWKGTIWQGKSKKICVPGLNCYSCPGALGSCPIGSLQSALAGGRKGFPYYAAGTLMLFGVLFGRLICGFLCPFGLIQDMLYKIKSKKLKVPEKADRRLRYIKYAILALFVILFPLVIHGSFGTGDPWFCKYICPAGTLEGGLTLVIRNKALRSMVGFLFSWKMALLVIFLISSVFIYRPFCKYVCPLGAIYGLFNRFSLYQMQVDHDTCVNCGACNKTCKMNVRVTENINSPECIRCGACKSVCPVNAIRSGVCINKMNMKESEKDESQAKVFRR